MLARFRIIINTKRHLRGILRISSGSEGTFLGTLAIPLLFLGSVGVLSEPQSGDMDKRQATKFSQKECVLSVICTTWKKRISNLCV